MLKKSFLTPVLSGVLAVTVVGSGVLYYFDNSGSKESVKAEKGEKKSVSEISKNVGETLDYAEKAVKGELDFSYTAKAELTFGEGITSELGYDIKPFAFEASTKQKGKKTSADFALQYDSKTLVSLNTVVDNESETVYAKIPELSDAYISADSADLEELVNEALYGTSYAYDDDYSSFSAGTTALAIASADMNADELMELLEDVDYEALFEDLADYADVIVDKLPDGKDNGSLTGDINGNTYDYTVKTYDITTQVVVDIATATAEKAENDTVLKDFCSQMGVTESDYDDLISELKDSVSYYTDDELSESVMSIDVYYSGDVVEGYSFDLEGVAVKMVSIETDDVYAIDFKCSEDGTDIFTTYGSATSDGSKVDGSFDFNVNDGSSDVASLSISFSDIEEQGDLFSGTILADMKITDSGETVNPAVEIVSESTADKLDLTMSLTESGTDYMTVKLTGEETDASDITIPSDNIYTLDEESLEAYLETCDVDAFEANIKNTLGDDLYEALLDDSSSYDYDDDWDWDDDDYDDDDDWDSYYGDYNDYTEEYSGLSSMKVSVAGTSITLQQNFTEDVQQYFDVDEDSLEEDDFAYFYDDDFNMSVCVENYSNQEAKIADCIITELSDYGSKKISFNGISVGSSLADIISAFPNADIDADENYCGYISFYEDNFYVDFAITDSEVTGLYVYQYGNAQ